MERNGAEVIIKLYEDLLGIASWFKEKNEFRNFVNHFLAGIRKPNFKKWSLMQNN